MTITECIDTTGLSMADFAREFRLNYRTLQNWVSAERGESTYSRKAPIYVYFLLNIAVKDYKRGRSAS